MQEEKENERLGRLLIEHETYKSEKAIGIVAKWFL